MYGAAFKMQDGVWVVWDDKVPLYRVAKHVQKNIVIDFCSLLSYIPVYPVAMVAIPRDEHWAS